MNYIKKISFKIEEKPENKTQIKIKKKGKKIIAKALDNDEKQEYLISEETWDALVQSLVEYIRVYDWKEEYFSPGLSTIKWSLKVTDSDDKKFKTFGYNCFPENFGDLCELLSPYFINYSIFNDLYAEISDDGDVEPVSHVTSVPCERLSFEIHETEGDEFAFLNGEIEEKDVADVKPSLLFDLNNAENTVYETEDEIIPLKDAIIFEAVEKEAEPEETVFEEVSEHTETEEIIPEEVTELTEPEEAATKDDIENTELVSFSDEIELEMAEALGMVSEAENAIEPAKEDEEAEEDETSSAALNFVDEINDEMKEIFPEESDESIEDKNEKRIGEMMTSRVMRYLTERARLENLEGKYPVGLAYEVASKAHMGMKDGLGLEAISHPLLVSSRLKDEKEKAVALLHDVIEDTEYTYDDIALAFGREIADAVMADTHADVVDYMAYIAELASNKLARAVKLADLEDNLERCSIVEKYDEDGNPKSKQYKLAKAYLENIK